MSPKLVQCGYAWDMLSNKEKVAAKSAIASIDKIQKKTTAMVSSVLKLGSALAVSAVGLGFSEAFGLEKYRMQLETATKDTERASAVMRYAVDLANKTPFEGGEMVAAASALEMATLKTETYLTTLGDVAAGSNRAISDVQTQFIKAFATGQTGEFFDSINVSRKSFEDFTKANKLSTASLEDTQIALKRFLDEKFGGGMANLAKTTAGAWSTITGVTKSGLAQLVGMGTDGLVRTGSAFDKLREKAQYFSEQLDKWQADGTIDMYARDIGTALEYVWDVGERVFTTLWKYRDVVGVIATIGVTVWGVQKAMTAYKTATEVARTAMMLLNGTLAVNPIMLAVMALGLAITQTQSFKDLLSELPSILDGTSEKFDNLGEAIGEVALELGEFGIKNFSIFATLRDSLNRIMTIVNAIGSLFTDEPLVPMLTKDGEWKKMTPLDAMAEGYVGGWAGEFVGAKVKKITDGSTYANGTHYHTGGLALVGERGPELVSLPSGSRVTTAEKTRKLGGGVTVYNYITIDGAQRSDEEIADMVARRIIEETDNAW